MQVDLKEPGRMRLARILCRPLPPILGQQVRELVYSSAKGRSDRYQFTVRSQTGSWYGGNTADYMSYPFGVCGYHSFRLWAVAIAVTRPGDMIVEIGANIGTETVGFADIVGRHGKVIAVEPLAANLGRLHDMIRLNDFRHVEVVPLAVAKTSGKTSFVLPDKNNSGVGFLSRETRAANSIEVDVTTLDELAPRIGKAAMLAIDVEGAELSVLEGGQQWLQRSRPVIALEANERHQSRNGSSLRQLAEYIVSLRYQVFAMHRFGLRSFPATDAASNPGDWVCIPEEAADVRASVDRHLRSCYLMPCLPHLNPMTGINSSRRRTKGGGI